MVVRVGGGETRRLDAGGTRRKLARARVGYVKTRDDVPAAREGVRQAREYEEECAGRGQCRVGALTGEGGIKAFGGRRSGLFERAG